MTFVRCLAVLALCGAPLAVALATADPQAVVPDPAPMTQTKATGSPPVVAAPVAPLPDIPENQAEIEALRNGTLKFQPMDATPALTVDPALETRRAAFATVVAEQDAKVQALAARLAGAADDQALLAIQREIEQEKLATGRRLLEVQLRFAAQDGDQAGVERLEAALAEWDAPPPIGTPVDRPVPDNQNR